MGCGHRRFQNGFFVCTGFFGIPRYGRLPCSHCRTNASGDAIETVAVMQQAARTGLRPSKNLFFDGITALCLSLFGFPGGKEHRETARSGQSVTPDEPAQPNSTG
jgi:hypothetical protein